MKTDPFEKGQRAARENIPAEANPYQAGTDEHALWIDGHEKVAGEAEANQSEGKARPLCVPRTSSALMR